MKKFFKTKLKVSTDYLIICVIITLGIIIMSAVSGIVAYRNNLSENQQSLQQKSIKAENIITEVINEHSWQIRLLADKIMKADNNLDKISQIIANYNKFDPKSNYDQFLNQKDLFWVNKNDNVVIKNKVGILEYPEKISKDYGVFNAKENSWKLIISKDLPFFQKDYSLILTSFGVTDSNGEYLGAITSSIDVSFIQNLLTKNLPTNTDNFIILNSDDNKIIFQSNPENIIDDPNFFTYKLSNINYDQSSESYLENDILERDINYTHYKRLTDYPLVILSGYDYQIYKSHLLKLILKAIYPSILVGFLIMIVLLLFYRRIVKPIDNLSKIARRIGSGNFDGKFPKKINSPEIFNLARALLKIKQQKIRLEHSNTKLTTTKNQLEEAIEVIKKSDIAQIEITKQIKKEILKNTSHAFHTINILKHNINNRSLQDDKVNLFLVNGLEQEIKNITQFATDELNKEYGDIRHIIDKAVLSQEKEIKIRKIKIDTFYNENLPKKVFVDQIRLIQILSSILYKTIKLLSEENHVKINVKTIIKNKTKQLSIGIEDNGFGIGFKDHVNDMKRLGGREENSINGIDISVDTIEELVSLHQGEIIYSNKIQQGATTIIIIPYLKKVNKKTIPPAEKIIDNIIYFPVKNKDK